MSDEDKRLEQLKRETLAQLAILEALDKVKAARRPAVMKAVAHILAADALVPGIAAVMLRGCKATPAEALARPAERAEDAK